ncbi:MULTISPECIES: DUF4199 domain-containing protein [Bizionia]|uniref:DUF4199 domain-containing protein n=1 Tax=Bizionia algoritergicola TaxID=291187 RepID=A0A5D0R2X1_9FLAO|nr:MULTISPECIES: DUF4199 domain-containing protein [Bizionia]OBX23646.1 hypothetical protein BAA08_03045 [Bizionia sp. APA-3]TYB75369.1 DUF4199 domain-containing protein [Bizionia algoritergicola]
MKQTVYKYGLYSSGLLILLFSTSFIFEGSLDYSMSEVVGYISIILSLLFIYFGIKYYRDTINNGILKFSKGLKIGLLISVFTSLTFGLINVVYTTFINPDFTTEYYNHSIETFRGTLSDADFQAKLIELESQREIFGNPFFNFFLMAFTVFIIGFVISVISSGILKRKA